MTNDQEICNRIMRLRSHGITRSPNEMTKISDGPWYYQQLELGYNYRLTDIQAALGVSQMLRIDEFIDQRHVLAEQYNNLFTGTYVRTPWQNPSSFSANHLYIVRLKNNLIGYNRKDVFERLRSFGIMVNVHYIPLYRQPYFEAMGFKFTDFPEAEAYYQEAISLPIYPSLTEAQQVKVVDIILHSTGHQTLF